MPTKQSDHRIKKYRERQQNMGVIRLDMRISQTTFNMLIEMVKKTGYDIDKGEQSKGVEGVLTQIVYEVFCRMDEIELDRKKQQGFILAQKLRNLRKGKFSAKAAKDHIKKEDPSYYLGKQYTEWDSKSLSKLINRYGKKLSLD